MADGDLWDEDITKQIATVAADPQVDLPATVRTARLDLLDVRKRMRRMERVAIFLAMSVLAGSSAVVLAIGGAMYQFGARMAVLDQLATHVAENSERIARIERGDGEDRTP